MECFCTDASYSRWKSVEYTKKDNHFYFVQDTETKEVYNQDSKTTIRLKAVRLVLATPVAYLARAVHNVACGRLYEAASSLYYGFLASYAAFYALKNPYEGRKRFAEIERAYHGDELYLDRRSNFYIAACFQPINYNVRCDSKETVKIISRLV